MPNFALDFDNLDHTSNVTVRLVARDFKSTLDLLSEHRSFQARYFRKSLLYYLTPHEVATKGVIVLVTAFDQLRLVSKILIF